MAENKRDFWAGLPCGIGALLQCLGFERKVDSSSTERALASEDVNLLQTTRVVTIDHAPPRPPTNPKGPGKST